MAIKVHAVYTRDEGKTARLWWYGDAAHQSAKEVAARTGEDIYPVNIVDGTTEHTDGWAVGSR